MRDTLARIVVLFGAVAAVLTELLSLFHLLRRGPLLMAWMLVAIAAAAFLYTRRPRLPRIAFRPFETVIAAAIASIAVPVGLTAWLSAPNTYDAMAYHLPRVVYWAQAGSVSFFPTPYFTQISLPPLAEYIMLHTYVLSGGDRFVNLLAFAAFLGCIIGVSAVAGALGAGPKAQILAAFFCATLPNAILQASGAKNDSLLALWLVLLVYFAARRETRFVGLAFGLALATKSTAYLFAPPLLGGLLLAQWIGGRRPRWLALAACLAAGAILMNGPQYFRNLQFSGSPVGFDSPYGAGGPYRWANRYFGWKPTASNAIRNLSDQLGERSARWNQGVYTAAIGLHRVLHIDPDDPDTTWGGWHFEAPASTAHEGSANNRWHLALLCAATAAALWFARKRRKPDWPIYAASLAAAFLFFCSYVKWEPAGARFLLPLFVLGSPLAGFFLAAVRPAVLAALLCVLLFTGTRLPVLKNWSRPLTGPHNLFAIPRDETYFLDILALHNRESYLEAVDRTAHAGCGIVGIDTGGDRAEYPFQALLRERSPAVQFLHSGVENGSARYYPRDPPRPCAVLCMDCGGDPRRAARYAAMGAPLPLGRFLLFLAK